MILVPPFQPGRDSAILEVHNELTGQDIRRLLFHRLGIDSYSSWDILGRSQNGRHESDTNGRWWATQTCKSTVPISRLGRISSIYSLTSQHPLDLLMRMSPLAFVQCVMYGWYTGELERVRAYGATQMTRSKAIALLINGIIACGLNIVSFTANKKSGPLTMTVSAK